jgi:hypothetical protein
MRAVHQAVVDSDGGEPRSVALVSREKRQIGNVGERAAPSDMWDRGYDKMVRLVSFSVALLFLFGCAGSTRDAEPLATRACNSRDWGFQWAYQFRFVPVDSTTKRFPTRYFIPSDNLTVSKDFALGKHRQRLYVMVVDAGRREFTPPTFLNSLFSISSKRKFVAGYDRNSLSIDESWRAPPGISKQYIDTFFQRSFQEIGFFDQVIVIPQEAFERIIRAGEDERRAPDKEPLYERLHQLPSELAALQRRYKDGAIGYGEYARERRKNESEQLLTSATINKSTVVFTNSTGLRSVQEYYSDYLIAHIVVRKTSRTNVTVELRMLDPATRNIVFYGQSLLNGWGRQPILPFDACVIYPLFNAFIDWAERNSSITR